MVIVTPNGKKSCTIIFNERTPAGMPVLVEIEDGRGEYSHYWAEPIPADFGTAVRFRGIGCSFEIADEDRERDVLLGAGNYSCECKGFLRHGHCKHGQAARQLEAAGLLKPAPRPEQAVEVPAKAARVPWCSRCNDEPGVPCSECSI